MIGRTAAISTPGSASLKWAFDYPFQAERPREIRLDAVEIPTWWKHVSARIVELAAVPAYDPRGVLPPNIDDVVDALNFLTRVMQPGTAVPWIGLLNSGGLQMSWKQGDVEVEVVFDHTRGEREIFVAVAENEWDAPADQADSLFCSVVDRLSHTDDACVAIA